MTIQNYRNTIKKDGINTIQSDMWTIPNDKVMIIGTVQNYIQKDMSNKTLQSLNQKKTQQRLLTSRTQPQPHLFGEKLDTISLSVSRAVSPSQSQSQHLPFNHVEKISKSKAGTHKVNYKRFIKIVFINIV